MSYGKRKLSSNFDTRTPKRFKSEGKDAEYVFVLTNVAYGEEDTALLIMKQTVYDSLEPLLLMLEDSKSASDYSPLSNGEMNSLLTIDVVSDFLSDKKLNNLEECDSELVSDDVSKEEEEEEREEEEPDSASVYDEDIDAVYLWFEVFPRLIRKGLSTMLKSGEKMETSIKKISCLNLVFYF